MRKLVLIVIFLAGCAVSSQPSPEEVEYSAYVNMLNEQIRLGTITQAQGRYMAAQKVNELRDRQAARRAAHSAADANSAAIMQQGINMMNRRCVGAPC